MGECLYLVRTFRIANQGDTRASNVVLNLQGKVPERFEVLNTAPVTAVLGRGLLAPVEDFLGPVGRRCQESGPFIYPRKRGIRHRLIQERA
jgi:hypothetical protein